MDYKIEQMDAFTVAGVEKTFQMDNSLQEIPKFWEEFFRKGMNEKVCPVFGICFDTDASGNFLYLIGDLLKPGIELPDGLITREVPAHLWARFACKGPMPGAIQSVSKQIYSEWLPTNGTYEVAQYMEIEQYSAGDTTSSDYESEVWIPVKKKA